MVRTLQNIQKNSSRPNDKRTAFTPLKVETIRFLIVESNNKLITKEEFDIHELMHIEQITPERPIVTRNLRLNANIKKTKIILT